MSSDLLFLATQLGQQMKIVMIWKFVFEKKVNLKNLYISLFSRFIFLNIYYKFRNKSLVLNFFLSEQLKL